METEKPKRTIPVKLMVALADNFYKLMAAFAMGAWQKNACAGLAMLFLLKALEYIINESIHKAMHNLTVTWLDIATKISNGNVVQHEVKHTITHKTDKEEWEP